MRSPTSSSRRATTSGSSRAPAVSLRLPDDRTVEGTVQAVSVTTENGQAKTRVTVGSDALKDPKIAELTHPGTPVAATLSLRDDGPLAGPTDGLRCLPHQDRTQVMRTLHSLTGVGRREATHRGRAGPLRAGLAVLTVAALATVTACTTSSSTSGDAAGCGPEGRGRR